MHKIIDARALREQCASILLASGSSTQEADKVAANLVLANLSGHDSHGVGMIPRYVEAVLEGGLKPNASVKVQLDAGAMLTLDGQRGYGQVVGEQAMQLGMARAKESGSCIMALANTHHLGRIGHFAEMAVAQGLVSIHFVNVLSRPVVAPWGGADGRYGTNPCCIGVPLKGREPFVLDFATSRVAQANGLFGALLAFGEHKGYGMAVACELLGGALTGGGTWHRPVDSARAVVNGMLTIMIDPKKLGTAAAFEQESLAFIDSLKQSPPAPGFDRVRIAGEPEREARVRREREGIVIDGQTWAEIIAAGKKVGQDLAS
jgi:uncharacterized oxidoreductase